MGKKSTTILILVIVAAVVITAIALIASSLKKLNSYEVGLKYDTVWRDLGDDPKDEGLYPGPPGFTFIKFPSVFKTIQFPGLVCLNKDGVPITLTISYQYKARSQHLREIVNLFRDHETYKDILESTGMAAIHEACSLYNTTQFQAERGQFQETVGVTLGLRNDPLYCDVAEIQVSNIARPAEYEEAIQNKEAAKENIKVSENTRPRLLTEAETALRQAETQADIILAQAHSQARIKLARAEATAEAILNQYDTEANTYEELTSTRGLSLTNDGFISYVGIRTISNAKNPVYIGLKSPAKTSYVDI